MLGPGCALRSARKIPGCLEAFGGQTAHGEWSPGVRPMTEAEIFTAALEKIDPREQSAFLAEACAGDQKLRRRIETLLRAHAQPDELLDAPQPKVATVEYVPLTEKPGTVVGPYKLLQQIGEGGFGVVYMAEQEKPVRRMVALKIIKPGMDTAQVRSEEHTSELQ